MLHRIRATRQESLNSLRQAQAVFARELGINQHTVRYTELPACRFKDFWKD